MNLNYLAKMMMKEINGLQKGGAMKGSKNSFAFLNILLITIVFFLIKVAFVYWTYNEVMPKILEHKFRPLTFPEAILLVILVQSLFK